MFSGGIERNQWQNHLGGFYVMETLASFELTSSLCLQHITQIQNSIKQTCGLLREKAPTVYKRQMKQLVARC